MFWSDNQVFFSHSLQKHILILHIHKNIVNT